MPLIILKEFKNRPRFFVFKSDEWFVAYRLRIPKYLSSIKTCILSSDRINFNDETVITQSMLTSMDLENYWTIAKLAQELKIIKNINSGWQIWNSAVKLLIRLLAYMTVSITYIYFSLMSLKKCEQNLEQLVFSVCF